MTDEGLVLAGADLARHSPELWRKFMTELDVHVERQVSTLLNANGNVLQAQQGSAKEAVYLCSILKSSVATADMIKAARK